jgi:hypothetical protein
MLESPQEMAVQSVCYECHILSGVVFSEQTSTGYLIHVRRVRATRTGLSSPPLTEPSAHFQAFFGIDLEKLR